MFAFANVSAERTAFVYAKELKSSIYRSPGNQCNSP